MYLILGGSGMLGSSFLEELSKYGSPKVLVPSHAELDITKEGDVFSYFNKHKPQIVINCAAAKNVDWCESNSQEAFLQNANSVGIVARASKTFGALFFHISTEYVFDGLKDGLYLETDDTNPINVYGASKLFGEKNALRYGGTVFRVQWLFGATKTNFIQWCASTVLTGKKASLIHQIGSPSSTSWVAQMILLGIAKKIPSGLVYHLAHDDFCTRVELAKHICSYFERKYEDHFTEVESVQTENAAKRPINSRMANHRFKGAVKLMNLGSWKEDVDYFLARNFKK